MKTKRLHILGLASVGILVAVFFYQTLLFGKLPVPTDTLVGLYHPWRDLYAKTNPRGVPFKNFLITDPVRQQIPWRKMSIEAWRSGHIPSWNPYNFAGTPLDANIQAAAFYPFNVLFFLFQFPVAWSMLIIMQPLCAGIFLYIYLRHRTVSPVASLLGAISWSLGGFSVAWMTWGTMMQTAMWLPLMLLSWDKLLSSAGNLHVRHWSVLMVTAIVMTALAGHAQIALYVYITATLYGVWRYRELPRSEASILIRGRPWKFIAIASVLFSAVAWFPLIQFLPETVRLTLAESATRPGWFLPWQNLVQFIVPDFFGNPATLNYWGVWNYGEFIGYIGLLPLIFALSVLFSRGVVRFWSSIVVVSIFFMLNHPITWLLQWANLPLVSVLQPTRLMVIVDLGLAILAAYGVDQFLGGKHVRAFRKVYVAIGLSLACVWVCIYTSYIWTKDGELIQNLLVSRRNMILPTLLYMIAGVVFIFTVRGKYTKIFWMFAVICIVSLDVLRFAWKFTPFTDPRIFFPTTKVIEYLQNQPKPFRIASLDHRILPPNVTGYYGLETIEGYDPLVSKRFEDFLRVSESGAIDLSGESGFNRIYTAHNMNAMLFPYFNVQYILSLVELTSTKLELVFVEGETRVYKYNEVRPRVYLAQDLTVMTGNTAQELLQEVMDAARQKQSTIVERALSVLSVPLGVDETAHIVAYDPYTLVVETQTLNSRLLVVLNQFNKKTRVTIDDTSARLEKVNYLFSGVVVPSGKHTVTLKY